MSKRAIIPLVIGLGVGVVALKIGLDVVKKAKGNRRDINGVLVVVAKAPIGREALIHKGDVTTVESPESLVPDGSFSDPAAVVGRVASVHIPKGMFLAESMLRSPGAKAGLEAAIPPGYRAVAVKVDEYVAVGNWLKPGARVDVLVVLQSRVGRKSQSMSRVVLHDVEVLAVGQVLDPTGKGMVKGRSVTVLVREEDAPRMHLASTKGKLRFALRGRNSGDDKKAVTITDADLFSDGDEETEPPPTDAKKPSLLGSLFGGLAHRRPAPTPTPEVVAEAPPEPQTWTVELLDGSSGIETFQFAGPSSSRRMDRGVQKKKKPAVRGRSGRPARSTGTTPVRGRRSDARPQSDRTVPDKDAARSGARARNDEKAPSGKPSADPDARFWKTLLNASGPKDGTEGDAKQDSKDRLADRVGDDDSAGEPPMED